MKKYLSLMLVLGLVLISGSAVSVQGSGYTLTESPKQTLYDLGYPQQSSSYINSWYNEFMEGIGHNSFHFGSFNAFGAFRIFVTNMQNETNPNNVSDFAFVARGVFDEVAMHPGKRIEDTKYIYDSLTNRVQNYSDTWGNYKQAASKWGLNSLNPDYWEYWQSMNVRRPIESASFSPEARQAVIFSYVIAWDKFQCGANPVSNPHFRLTNLPGEYVYFNKSTTYPTNNPILRGSYYYHTMP